MIIRKYKILILTSSLFLILLICISILLNSLIKKTKNNYDNHIEYYSKYEEPNKITISNSNNEFTILKSNDEFSVTGFDNVPINKAFCSAIFKAAQKLNAQKIFENVSNLNKYGLESPNIIANIHFDNENTKLRIGNMNPDKTAYYCLDESHSKIALIRLPDIDPFLKSQHDFANLTPINSMINHSDGEQKISRITIERKDLPKIIQITNNEKEKFIINESSQIDLNDTIQNQLKNSIFSLVAQKLHTLNPDDNIKKSCGLDDPFAKILYVINDKNFEIQIGNIISDNDYKNLFAKKNINHLCNHLHEEESHKKKFKLRYVSVCNIPAIYIIDESELPWLCMQFPN